MTMNNPTEIRLHKGGFGVSLTFDRAYTFPATTLRIHSPAADNKGEKQCKDATGVSIKNIELRGNYALQVYFSDGHNGGIFTWDIFQDLIKDGETL